MKNFLLTCALLGASIPAFAAGNVITYVNCDANSFQNFTNNYTNDWKLKNSADQYWTVKNFNNNNGGWEDFIRTGWRTAAIVGSVTTDFMIAEQVGEIVVDVWQCKTGLNDKLNKASIYVADNLDFENAAEYDFTDKVTTDEFEQAVSVKITAPKANQYYMVAFDCGKASNNGFIQLAGITYYEHEGGEVPALKPAGLSYDWTEYEAVLGEDFVAPTLNNPNNLSVVYSSSNTDVATVDVNTGKVTLVNAGLVTITATSAATDEFEAGEASYVIAVQGKSDTDGVLFSFNPLKENQIESVNSYSDVWTVKDGDLEWTVAYFNNNKNGWDFVRAGNKNVDYVPFIETDFASNGTVASLEIDMEIRSGGTPTKATVYTSSTDDYTNAVGVDFTESLATGVVKVNLPDPKENQYIKVEFDCPKGTANGYLQINKIDYVGIPSATQLLPSGIKYEETEFNVVLGDDFTAPKLENPNGLKVSYTSSDTEVATVAENGDVTILGAGTTVITATTEANETFSAGKASYTINVMDAAKNLAEFIEKAPAKGDKMMMMGDVTVVYVNGSNVYIKDETASSLIYASNLGLEKGNVLPGGWSGEVDIYNGLYEIKPVGTLPAVTESVDVTYPTVSSASELVMNEVVILQKVVFAEETPSDKVTFTGVMNGENVTFYNTFKVEGVEAATYDVLGAVAVYKENLQVYPLEYTKTTDDSVALIEAENGAAVYFNLQGVKVAAPANGVYIRVQGGKATKVIVD